MTLARAGIEDCDRLLDFYRAVIERMHREGLCFWDEDYPLKLLRGDIKKRRLYALCDRGQIRGAFALCDAHSGIEDIGWRLRGKALFIDRFCVDAQCRGQGLGTLLMRHAFAAASAQGAGVLRLVVADENPAAIAFYRKNGFLRVPGQWIERFDDGSSLTGFGMERHTAL